MKAKKKSYQNFFNHFIKYFNRWFNEIVIGGIVAVIILLTLFPFNFTPTQFYLPLFSRHYGAKSDLNDLIGNVLLFMPFGFYSMGLLFKSRGLCAYKPNLLKVIAVTILTVCLSFSLSFSIETLQVYLPSRNSDLSDIITNSTGGFLGAIAYCLWNLVGINHHLSLFINKIKPILSRQKLAAALIIWVLFTGFFAIQLQKATDLSNWDSSFPLVIGNEATGDRSWQGTVSQLQISPQAIKETEIAKLFANRGFSTSESLVANYSFQGKNNYQDRTNQLPNLVWQGNIPQERVTGKVKLTSSHWLSTPTAATSLSEKVRQSSQFTISTIVATANPEQSGPARIISLSKDPLHRNFTLGQEKNELVFRLRTPITGENGMYTDLSVPGIFQNKQLNHLVFTYERSVLKLYVNKIENLSTLALTPEITLFRYLFPFQSSNFSVSKLGLLVSALLYYLLFFVPLGILTALIITLFPGRFSFTILLLIGAIIVPAIGLEFLIQAQNSLRLNNLAFSIAIAVMTMLLVKNKLNLWLTIKAN